ncbi:MAG: helix-turn-helix domain-containing protein [Oliverpabstia sp.]
MEQKTRDILIKISKLSKLDMYLMKNQNIEIIREYAGNNPLYLSESLRTELLAINQEDALPKIIQDKRNILFAAIKGMDEILFCGPFCIHSLNKVEIHQYYMAHGIKIKEEQDFPVLGLSKSLMIISLVCSLFNGHDFSEEELMSGNHMDRQLERNQISEEEIIFDMRLDMEEEYHHTYQKERELLDCVREGQVEAALSKNMGLDIETGRLSDNEVTHWHNLVVVAITLTTRAAIEGGLSPSKAYQISDFYIQKSNHCKTITELIVCRNRAVEQLTTEVAKVKASKRVTYVDGVMEYVQQHYKEKIYLEDVADRLGVTTTYLSRLFKRETGESFADYVVRVRVERAANLLIYSEESISYIAEYVHFPNQSYLGKVFKKVKGMTPKEYRNKFKPKEFKTYT